MGHEQTRTRRTSQLDDVVNIQGALDEYTGGDRQNSAAKCADDDVERRGRSVCDVG